MMTTYRVADGVLRAELDGEAVLLNPDTGVYHLLNSTGVTVLDRIERDGDPTPAVDEISERSGVEADRVADDVQAFISALIERKLLARAEP
jgi:hypothetical protein